METQQLWNAEDNDSETTMKQTKNSSVDDLHCRLPQHWTSVNDTQVDTSHTHTYTHTALDICQFCYIISTKTVNSIPLSGHKLPSLLLHISIQTVNSAVLSRHKLSILLHYLETDCQFCCFISTQTVNSVASSPHKLSVLLLHVSTQTVNSVVSS